MFFGMVKNLYDARSDRFKNEQRYSEYFLNFIEKVGNLYDITFTNELFNEILSSKILQYAFVNGHCAIKKFEYDGKYHVGTGNYTTEKTDGKLNADGLPTAYTITLLNGEQETGVIGEDVIVLKWNNLGLSGISMVERYSDMLSKIDTSMVYNVLYSRVCPIPIVNDDIEKRALDSILDNLFDGVKKIFKRQRLSDKLGGDVKTLDLTNPQTSVYLQNLSRFHDEIIVRACLEFGIFISVRDKGAQLNNEELSAFSDYCTISADDTLTQLKAFAEELNRVFNAGCTVRAKEFISTVKDIEESKENMEESDAGELPDDEGEDGENE